jgi:hypothetical protein
MTHLKEGDKAPVFQGRDQNGKRKNQRTHQTDF